MPLPDEYALANELMEQECDRYWNRSNIMLLIQGALIALDGAVYGKSQIISIAVAMQGILFSIFWFGIVHKGSLYVGRWDKVIKDLETDLKSESGEKFYALRHLNDASRLHEKKPRFMKRFLNQSTTKLMKLVIMSAIVFWLFLLSYSIFFYNSNIEKITIEKEGTNPSGITQAIENCFNR